MRLRLLALSIIPWVAYPSRQSSERLLIAAATLLIGAMVRPVHAAEDASPAFAGEASNVPAFDTDRLLSQLRDARSGEACQVAQDSVKAAIDAGLIQPYDTRLIDSALYMVQRSTDPQCVLGHMTGLDAPISYSGQLIKDQKKLWTRIGRVLASLLNGESTSDWHVRFYAAQILRRMGPPYQERAYQFFLDELRRLARTNNVNDDAREEAVNFIDQFVFDYPDGPHEGFFRKTQHVLPKKLLRKANSNLNLLIFWPSYVERLEQQHAYLGHEKERIAEFKRLLEDD